MKVAINVHTEWDRLREVVVGVATGAQKPTVKDHALRCIEYATLSDVEFAQAPCGPLPPWMIAEANEDLDRFAESLKQLGITVHRPQVVDFTQLCRTGDWEVDGYHAYCPRDSVLTVGRQAIETPMVLRHRWDEARTMRSLFDTIQAPRPRLLDSMYDRSRLGVPTLMNHEPAFDAANCLKLGRDILYLISNTGNQAGCDWLQKHLGSEYRVHPVRDVYAYIHIDSTILPLRPGLVLLCPDRVNAANLPPLFRNWEKVYAPDPGDIPCDPRWNPSSKWIAMNCLSLAPDLVAVESRNTHLMHTLAGYGIESLPVQLRHFRTMGGGPHCVTLDLVRDGTLESYT